MHKYLSAAEGTCFCNNHSTNTSLCYLAALGATTFPSELLSAPVVIRDLCTFSVQQEFPCSRNFP